jgi:hypothetical protein
MMDFLDKAKCMTQEEVCTQLKTQFGDAVSALSETKGDRFVVVKGEKIVDVCRFLKTTTGLRIRLLPGHHGRSTGRPARSSRSSTTCIRFVHRHGLV